MVDKSSGDRVLDELNWFPPVSIFLRMSKVALCRPPDSSPVGFAGQYVLMIWSLEPVVSIVIAMASPSPVVSLQSPSIFCFSLEFTKTSWPPTVWFVMM